MLRMLRILGIVVFALVLGYAANSIFKMYGAGKLFDQYNSQRKADLTLSVLSLTALISLGSFEMHRLTKPRASNGYGKHRYAAKRSRDEVKDTSSIYSTREHVDEWRERRSSGALSRKQDPSRYLPEIWVGVLRIIYMVLPLFYAVFFSYLFIHDVGGFLKLNMFCLICSIFVFLTIISAVGVFKMKTWGLSLGYLLAILNLVVFPIGTAVGLFLLIALVGASPTFAQSVRKRGRMHRFV